MEMFIRQLILERYSLAPSVDCSTLPGSSMTKTVAKSSCKIQVFCICYAMIGVPLFYYIMKRTSDFLLEKFKQLEKCVSRVSIKFASAISLLVYVVGGFISCSLIPAVVFHHIEGWTLLQAWYFTMITLLTIGFGDYCPTGK